MFSGIKTEVELPSDGNNSVSAVDKESPSFKSGNNAALLSNSGTSVETPAYFTGTLAASKGAEIAVFTVFVAALLLLLLLELLLLLLSGTEPGLVSLKTWSSAILLLLSAVDELPSELFPDPSLFSF